MFTRRLKTLALALALFAAPLGAQQKDIVDTAVAAGSFKTLAAALGKAGLVDTLKGDGPFTVFAPTDEAFAKLPEGTVSALLLPENRARLIAILSHHVVAGHLSAEAVLAKRGLVMSSGQRADLAVTENGASIDGAQITKTDIKCRNGVIHVIDSVILPAEKDIVETAVGAGSFKTLAAALGAAGLVDALKGKGPFTVFAPTDAAFAKLPKGTVESLLLPENKAKLIEILTYHVVPGRVYSESVVSLERATSLEGRDIAIRVADGKVFVNDAQVVATDIDASNGVIHVIDNVILPKAAPKVETGKAERMIRRAIDRGVPLYNGGNPEACAALYRFCAESLVELSSDELSPRHRRMLTTAMAKADATHAADQRAWTLREAFDAILEQRPIMAKMH